MRVTVLYFAAMRDVCGREEEAIDASLRTTDDLRAHLESKYPALRDHRNSIRMAKNESFIVECERLADGDVVALIPPVQGG